jgi:hypothetical protein
MSSGTTVLLESSPEDELPLVVLDVGDDGVSDAVELLASPG